MKPGDDRDDPPSYEDSVRPHEKGARSETGLESNTDHVYSLLRNYIIPHIQNAISSETASTTIVFVPSHVDLHPPKEPDSKKVSDGFPGEQLVGFPKTEELKLIRLSDNTIGFWQRASSRQSLSDSLHAYLVQEGCYFREDIARAEASRAQAGWMTVDGAQLGNREASINFELQEVCLRVENDMGLYESMREKALVLRVRLGFDDHSLA